MILRKWKSKLPINYWHEDLADIDIKELKDIVKAAKNRKATELDCINAELCKDGGLLLHMRHLHLFN